MRRQLPAHLSGTRAIRFVFDDIFQRCLDCFFCVYIHLQWISTATDLHWWRKRWSRIRFNAHDMTPTAEYNEDLFYPTAMKLQNNGYSKHCFVWDQRKNAAVYNRTSKKKPLCLPVISDQFNDGVKQLLNPIPIMGEGGGGTLCHPRYICSHISRMPWATDLKLFDYSNELIFKITYLSKTSTHSLLPWRRPRLTFVFEKHISANFMQKLNKTQHFFAILLFSWSVPNVVGCENLGLILCLMASWRKLSHPNQKGGGGAHCATPGTFPNISQERLELRIWNFLTI